MQKKLSCNLANLPPCDPCKLVAWNNVAWEAWEAWKYSCMEVAFKKHVKKHFFPVTEKVIT